jgi:hypothetical protein
VYIAFDGLFPHSLGRLIFNGGEWVRILSCWARVQGLAALEDRHDRRSFGGWLRLLHLGQFRRQGIQQRFRVRKTTTLSGGGNIKGATRDGLMVWRSLFSPTPNDVDAREERHADVRRGSVRLREPLLFRRFSGLGEGIPTDTTQDADQQSIDECDHGSPPQLLQHGPPSGLEKTIFAEKSLSCERPKNALNGCEPHQHRVL